MKRIDRYESRSHRLLEIALDSVQAYEPWREFDPGTGAGAGARYAAMPVLNKAIMRQHGPQGFYLPGLDYEGALAREEIELVATSGTTEERIENVWYQPWWDDSERASWALNRHAAGIDGTQREAILTGPLQAGRPCESGTLSMAQRTMWRFLYLNEKPSPDLWTPSLMDRMLDELSAFAPVTLEANPSLLAKLARYAAQAGRRVYQPRLIVLTYENPSLLHRRAIARVFSAPVASSYGATEAAYVFMECEHGSLHQVTRSCRVDFEPLRTEHGGPRCGRLLVTTFGNPWRVLLRFDIGDLATLRDTPCPCGRTEGLTLASIDGRTASMTFGRDGHGVTPGAVDRAMAAVDGLAEYQLTQEAATKYSVLLVPEHGAHEHSLSMAASHVLRGLYGQGAEVSAAVVPSFPPGPSGKYRLVQNNVPFDAARLFSPQV